MRIGNVDVAGSVRLAPMAAVTNAPFRLVAKECGSGLLTSEEIEEFDLAREADYCSGHGITFQSFPIPDHDTPDSYRAVRVFVERLSKDLIARKGVLIHCQAGFGRSVLLAACTLCVTGVSVNGALELLSRARGWDVPETELQRAWVHRFAQRVRAAKSA